MVGLKVPWSLASTFPFPLFCSQQDQQEEKDKSGIFISIVTRRSGMADHLELELTCSSTLHIIRFVSSG